MVRNPAVTPESKPKTALFFLKLGGYLPEWHIFQMKKWIPFTGYFTEISGWVCSVLSSYGNGHFDSARRRCLRLFLAIWVLRPAIIIS
jgi:hypothetical protein